MTALLATVRRLDARAPRRLLGSVVVLFGAALLGSQALDGVAQALSPDAIRAFEGGLLGALATALGALPVLVTRRIPERVSDALLGFGAGVMLAATAFSLIIPALSAAGDLGHTQWGAGALVSTAVIGGVLVMLWLDRAWPHAHFDAAGQSTRGRSPGRLFLFVIAIVLHNIPEGMAVGVAAGAHAPGASGLALGIAIQDMPEGLVVALALVGAGVARGKAALVGMASGLVEPAAALVAALAVGTFGALLPWGLALAGGAMLFAVSHEVIPESHRNGHETDATLGLALGFCLMMVMDTALV